MGKTAADGLRPALSRLLYCGFLIYPRVEPD
jgi:hypothetical protein